MRTLSYGLAIVLFGVFSAGCATGHGRVRAERFGGVADRVSAKQSSYRIRGTDETGVLTATQKRQLQSRTRAWRWPTNSVVLTSSFGNRGGHHHDGVDLRAPMGTPVRAAADGKVLYSGAKIRGYGRMIVLRHEGKLSTVYAHNSKLLVSTGQRVRRGQKIALSGNTGHSSGPHLHFEVREGVTAIDPILLMPSPAVANEANRRMAGGSARAPARRPPSRYSQSSTRRPVLRRGSPHVAARVADRDDGFKPRSPRAHARPN